MKSFEVFKAPLLSVNLDLESTRLTLATRLRIIVLAFIVLTFSWSSINAAPCVHSSVEALHSGLNSIHPTCIVNTHDLLNQRVGFAKAVTGGLKSELVYKVTSLADSGEGTLRDAIALGSAWIIFEVSGVIELKSNLRIQNLSGITIDGRGAAINISNYGLLILDSNNIIVENIIIENGASAATDAVTIARSNNVWIDHVTLSNFPDGLLDITHAALNKTRVTVSWSRFENHSKTMIIGLHSDFAKNDRYIYVTMHHNIFAGTEQRHPRLSQGYAHLYNNALMWSGYGAASFDNARLLAEANYFINLDYKNRQAIKFDFKGSPYPAGRVRAPMSGANANRVMGASTISIEENKPYKVVSPSYAYTLDSFIDDCSFFKLILNAGSYGLKNKATAIPSSCE